jgi:hypothetical protein
MTLGKIRRSLATLREILEDAVASQDWQLTHAALLALDELSDVLATPALPRMPETHLMPCAVTMSPGRRHPFAVESLVVDLDGRVWVDPLARPMTREQAGSRPHVVLEAVAPTLPVARPLIKVDLSRAGGHRWQPNAEAEAIRGLWLAVSEFIRPTEPVGVAEPCATIDRGNHAA